MLCSTSYLFIHMNDVLKAQRAKYHLIVITQICTFCALWRTDFVIEITQLCYFCTTLPLVANLVVIIQITLLFILKFSSQLKRSQCLRFIYCYFSKNIAAGESRWNSECGWKYRNAGVTRQMRVTWHICVIKVANLNLESNQSLKVIYWSNQKVWKSFPKPSTYVVLNLQSK